MEQVLEPQKKYRSFRLQFFAKEGPGGEKTEEATTKKLEDARKEGQVSKSQELTNALSLMGLFLALKL
ncbi:MAG: EscU/YscU/HrcU family type III secretion system export apparatus switch protein, partial [Lachnospiraceae bacterium]|nr:EscU/YscU/HrcU family type III secretion system export apparatus switch protein [Lachnospiraceae bacterium]